MGVLHDDVDADTDEDAFNEDVAVDVSAASGSGTVVEEMVGNDEEEEGVVTLAVATELSEHDDGAFCGEDEELASSCEETSLPKALSFFMSRVEFEAKGFSEEDAVEIMETKDPCPEDSEGLEDAAVTFVSD